MFWPPKRCGIWTGFWIFLYLFHWTNDCDPVPIPGVGGSVADMTALTQVYHSMSTQRRLTDFFSTSPADKGEGSCEDTPTGGANPWFRAVFQNHAKGDIPPPMGSDPNVPNCVSTAVQKRSFRRACNRALQQGATWYRGRLFTAEEVPPHIRMRSSSLRSTNNSNSRPVLHQPSKAKRISCLTWNAGGDFNCSLREAKPWTGPGCFRWKNALMTGKQHKDGDQFLQLLQRYDLTAINTWCQHAGSDDWQRLGDHVEHACQISPHQAWYHWSRFRSLHRSQQKQIRQVLPPLAIPLHQPLEYRFH